MNTSYHVRGNGLIAILAGFAVGALGACSLLTKLDAPTAESPSDGAVVVAEAGADDGADSGPVPDACASDAAIPYYAAQYVDQSFPLTSSGALTMVPGQVISAYIELTNTGSVPGTRIRSSERPSRRTGPAPSRTARGSHPTGPLR
jgi:hypothetical protein